VIEVVPLDNVPLPSVTPPSANVTVPSGVPEAELTVAVKVCESPYVDGEGSTEIAVVVLGGFCTTWIKLAEEDLKFCPAKTADTVTWPTVVNGIVAENDAVPPEIWKVLV
jgi:hypothetical protein